LGSGPNWRGEEGTTVEGKKNPERRPIPHILHPEAAPKRAGRSDESKKTLGRARVDHQVWKGKV